MSKTNIKVLLVLICAALGSSAFGAVTLQVIANAATGQVRTSTSGTLADGSLMRVGFFNVPALTALTPSELLDFDTVNALFVEFASFTSSGGNFGSFNNTLPATSVGQRLFWWVFDSSSAATAEEYGIFSSSAWLSPSDQGTANMVSSQINSVIVGSTNGSSPVNYTLAPIPEPAHFALLLGSLGLGVILWRRRR